MKVKESFVTNSSSTSYIIYLPESIDPINMIKDKDPNILGWIEDQDLNVLKRMFEKARKDSETSLNDYDMDMFVDEDEEGYYLVNDATSEQEEFGNKLRTVFLNGEITVMENFDTIRDRLASYF